MGRPEFISFWSLSKHHLIELKPILTLAWLFPGFVSSVHHVVSECLLPNQAPSSKSSCGHRAGGVEVGGLKPKQDGTLQHEDSGWGGSPGCCHSTSRGQHPSSLGKSRKALQGGSIIATPGLTGKWTWGMCHLLVSSHSLFTVRKGWEKNGSNSRTRGLH